jgi:pilus assembly protein CpaC
MLQIIFYSYLMLSSTCLFAANEEPRAEIALSIGRTYLWKIGAGSPVSISNGAVIRAVDQGPLLKVTALKIGTSVIRTKEQVLEVAVVPESSYRIYEALKTVMEPMRGLKLSLDTGKLSVSGKLLRFEDWQKIESVARSFPADSFTFTASIDDDVRPVAEAALKIAVADAGMTALDFHFNPSVSVQVPATPSDLKDRANMILRGYGIPVRESSSSIQLAPLVRVRIVVAEVKKSMMAKVGVDWPGHIGGQILPTAEWDSFSLSLNAAEATGAGKILASPVLLCRSGKEAEFLAGGEFPIKVASLHTHELIWKKYGIVLKIKPLADLAGRMSIAIESEVSMIDAAHTVDGIPGLLTNRIETHFDLTSARTIALSGLIKKEWSESRQGLIGLSSIPILGPLFSSRDYRDDLSELVVFVTPEVVDIEKGT